MTKIHEAAALLTNNQYDTKELLNDLEMTYRTFAYNHIALEDDSHCGKKETASSLFLFETLIDGLKGKFINKK